VTRWAIADTGPLVAYLDRGDASHDRVMARFKSLEAPVLVCEPVLTEAMFLLRRAAGAQDQLFGLLGSGALRLAFALEPEREAVRALHRKYGDVPMSLADACLVRMAELHDDHSVFTLDAHFAVYRKHGNQPIALVTLEG
jgi:predicted nucleic acid-binding protein